MSKTSVAGAMRLGVVVGAMMMAVGCASTPPAEPDNVCAIFTEKPGWHRAAQQMQKRWGVPLTLPMAMMYQESSYRAKAKAPRDYVLWVIPWGRKSSAYGYSQAIDGTWRQYQQATGRHGADRDDFADAMDFIGWYIDTAARRVGIGRADGYRQYLAYHEGWEGYRRGSYQTKAWLKKVAKRVAARQRRYQSQYQRCRDQLPKARRFLWF